MFFLIAILLLSVSVCFAGLHLEATDGENVTIPLETAELDRADQVIITFTREKQKNLIAQYCRCVHCGDCNVVEIPGVLLQVKERTLILLDVSSRNSGLYEAKIVAEKVFEENALLVVNKPPFFSSIEPPQTSISKPPNSENQVLYVLIALVLALVVFGGILGVYFCCKRMKTCKKNNCERNSSDSESPL